MGPPPSAPPVEDDDGMIPVVTAMPITSASTSTPIATARIVNSTEYEDGRLAAVIHQPQQQQSRVQSTNTATNNNAAVRPSPPAAPTTMMSTGGALLCQPGIRRQDLGARPVNITCGSCHCTGITKAYQLFGICTFISFFVLLLLFFPLFWIPFICPSVS